MPEAPLPPTPAPVDNALSGGTWISGTGQNQVSGAVSADSAYAEITQWLTIDYTRNPYVTTRLANIPFRNLSNFSATEAFNITATRLHLNVTAHTSCKKVFQTYGTSAFYQPQKFSVLANEFDKIGTSYGTVDGSGNAFVFGPQGSVQTIQPYISRVPWVNAIHTAYSLTQTGTSDGMSVAPPIHGGTNHTWGLDDIMRPYADYLHYPDDIYDPLEGDMRSYIRRSNTFAGHTFPMAGGGYNTSSEPGYGNNVAGVQFLIQFIEYNCSFLSNSNYQSRFPILLPVVSDGFSWIQAADRIVINPYYNTGFHDYT
jgi:hypothetical protein